MKSGIVVASAAFCQGIYQANEPYQQPYYGYTASGLYQAITGSHSGPCGPNSNQACVMLNGAQFPNEWVMSVAHSALLRGRS